MEPVNALAIRSPICGLLNAFVGGYAPVVFGLGEPGAPVLFLMTLL